jgi:hypothetical protein
MNLETPDDAVALLRSAWPGIVREARATLGGELFYQALAYHHLRMAGAPVRQIGMNVKQYVTDPVSALFKTFDLRKHEDYRGGFEPIPDIVLFTPEVDGDWRRRKCDRTLLTMLAAIEVKASERAAKRLTAGELTGDVEKLAAHREEVRHRGGDMLPVVMIFDVAPEATERVRPATLDGVRELAASRGVAFLYVSPSTEEAIFPTTALTESAAARLP